MKRRVYWLAFGALALAAAVLPAAQAHAQSQAGCGPFNPNCVPSPFERRPFNPSYCSPSSPHACTPRWGGALGQGLQLTIQSSKVADYAKPDHDLDTIADLFDALRACWQPPEAENKSPGMQMSVRISFKRGGEMFGHPRLTYATPGSSSQTRQIYQDAIDAALARCAPLTLTKGLGGAIAGRPINIRYVDDRGEQQGQRNDQQ